MSSVSSLALKFVVVTKGSGGRLVAKRSTVSIQCVRVFSEIVVFLRALGSRVEISSALVCWCVWLLPV